MADLSGGRQSGFDRSNTDKAPLTSAVFMVENSKGTATFSELAGISSEVEQAEYMEVGGRGTVFGRFVGKAKPPTVTLKRAMTTGGDTHWIWLWHAAAREASPMAYVTTDLKLFPAGADPSGSPTKAYTLVNAFPTKVEIAGMKAGGTEVVIQTVTLQCDEITEF